MSIFPIYPSVFQLCVVRCVGWTVALVDNLSETHQVSSLVLSLNQGTKNWEGPFISLRL